MTAPPSTSSTDEELIAAANRGDASAFEALYYRYREWVIGLAQRFACDNGEALDVLQDTFLYFWRKFPGFALRARLTTFLYPVVRNESISKLRLHAREVVVEELPLVPIPERIGDTIGLRQELAGALRDLSAAHREVLVLRFVDEMTVAEIAAATGIAEGTVKSRIHHAVRRLREDPRMRLYWAEQRRE
ncbi:MAG: sigma-70 family RNA polymerase sigma factor [Candidatus Schekmanbacteria bacterium]|nr:sigma-70 family RNA polymerase sigma factor [Candidatus Schekmanbacteria bacterium]